MLDKDNLINEARRVFDEEIYSLEKVKSRISGEFTKAVEIISEASKIIFTGVGKSGIIAKKNAATFSSIGISSFFLHPLEALHGDIGTVQTNDAAILISKSGSTEEIVRLVPYLRMRKAKIISLTGNSNSFLARTADVSLDCSVEKEACPFNLAPTSSTTVALAMGDALAICCMKVRNVTIEDFSRLHPLGQIGRNITLKVNDVMHCAEKTPRISQDALFKEAIIELTNKNLGCVCVFDGYDRLVGIITDGDIKRILQNFGDITNISVEQVMTKNPITVSEEAFLNEALALMENRTGEISVLPVVDSDGKYTGLISIHDIIHTGT